MSDPLSPAAQAILDSVVNEAAPLSERRQQITDAGVVLRTVARFAPFFPDELESIADELEGRPDG